MNVELNAVDPAGEEPPDELFHRADGDDTALVRRRDGWELRLYEDGEQVGDGEHFEDFERAFAEFASYAYDVEHRSEVGA